MTAVDHEAERAARAAAANVIGRLAAARLGRGLLPLAAIAGVGLVRTLIDGAVDAAGASGLVLLSGALISAATLIVYGNGALRRVLGKGGWVRRRLETLAGLVPYAFALYVLGFGALQSFGRIFAGHEVGPVALGFAAVLLAVSLWLLRSLGRVTELHRLARTMVMPAPGETPDLSRPRG